MFLFLSFPSFLTEIIFFTFSTNSLKLLKTPLDKQSLLVLGMLLITKMLLIRTLNPLKRKTDSLLILYSTEIRNQPVLDSSI